MIIAVDFDGTLCKGSYPEIGEPNYKVLKWVKDRQMLGDKIILWTCREGMELQDAIIHCGAIWNLIFDAVNENIPGIEYGNLAKHKVCADIYLDDRAMNVKEIK